MKLLSLLLIALVPFSPVFGSSSASEDISGTWIFSVDLANGGHGDPTFVFNQTGENVTALIRGRWVNTRSPVP